MSWSMSWKREDEGKSDVNNPLWAIQLTMQGTVVGAGYKANVAHAHTVNWLFVQYSEVYLCV